MDSREATERRARAALDELTADERRALGLVADRLGKQRAAASGAQLALRPRPRPLQISA